MAATVSSVWSKPGAWALDSEENDAAELLHHQNEQKTTTYAAAKANSRDAADFPSLAAAASTKTKKKKPQSMTLSEFATAKPATYQKPTQTLTHEDLMMLPTGPRERTAEELDRSRLGGGFRSYGSNNESSSSKWGSSSRVSSDEMPRRQDRELAPSRADEVDDWGATKKSVSSNGFDRRERGGERGERGGFFGSESRADDSDNWGAKKSFVPSSEGRRERRVVGFESNGGADSGNWLKKEEEGWRKIGGGAFDSLRERRGGLDSNGVDSENWGKKRGEDGIGSGGGARPRLNLQPRTLPVADVTQQNGGTGGATPPKPKGSNPFGEARPREEVLKEKGQDWKEIDEKLELTKIKEGDGAGFGKRSLSFGSGSGSGRATTPDEKSWRKEDSADVRPSSADKVEVDLDNVEGNLAEEAEETRVMA